MFYFLTFSISLISFFAQSVSVAAFETNGEIYWSGRRPYPLELNFQVKSIENTEQLFYKEFITVDRYTNLFLDCQSTVPQFIVVKKKNKNATWEELLRLPLNGNECFELLETGFWSLQNQKNFCLQLVSIKRPKSMIDEALLRVRSCGHKDQG